MGVKKYKEYERQYEQAEQDMTSAYRRGDNQGYSDAVQRQREAREGMVQNSGAEWLNRTTTQGRTRVQRNGQSSDRTHG